MPRQGLLVRVGIDATDGRWNAPVRRSTGEFVYVPITEVRRFRCCPTTFDEFEPALTSFGVPLPEHLVGVAAHLDPDFSTLTYGDRGQRARSIAQLKPGDFLVFYASLREADQPESPLIYSIVGYYDIAEIVPALDIPNTRWTENAHTRRTPGSGEIVVRAAPGSGRLRYSLPIGEYRNRAYRVQRNILRDWGGLAVKDGFLQRSARLPRFLDAEKFLRWFHARSCKLIPHNNLVPDAPTAHLSDGTPIFSASTE